MNTLLLLLVLVLSTDNLTATMTTTTSNTIKPHILPLLGGLVGAGEQDIVPGNRILLPPFKEPKHLSQNPLAVASK